MKETKFIYNSSGGFTVNDFDTSSVKDKIRPAIYQYVETQFGPKFELYSERFKLPEHVFSIFDKTKTRILNDFNNNSSSSGVIFTGNKGSGKSVAAYQLCNDLIDQGMPVIKFSSAPEDINDMISEIDKLGDVVLFFDEYGKGFNKNAQNLMLSLFSNDNHKRFSVITENEVFMLSEYILNRAGRFKYHIRYGKINDEDIKTICDHFNMDDTFREQVTMYSNSCQEFSIDTLVSIIKEQNSNPDLSFKECISIMNIPQTTKSVWELKETLFNNKKTDSIKLFYIDEDGTDPAIKFISEPNEKTSNDSELVDEEVYFGNNDRTMFKNDSVVYETKYHGDKITIVLEKKKEDKMDYNYLF